MRLVITENIRGFWPKQTNDRTGITDHLNRVPKYVVSSSLENPVVIGRGRRLFADGGSCNLRLAGAKPFRSGVVLLTYRRR